jgi:hypothetical protein
MQLGKALAQGVAADEAPEVAVTKPTEVAVPVETKVPETVA